MKPRLTGTIVGLFTAGCVGVVGHLPSRIASMSALTEEDTGVCVAVRPVRSCLSTNRVGDPPTSFVETTLASEDPAMAFPRNWRIVVTRDDGEVVLDQQLTPRGMAARGGPVVVPMGGYVGQYVAFEGKALERVPPWRPGAYAIRYHHEPTSHRIDLKVQLR